MTQPNPDPLLASTVDSDTVRQPAFARPERLLSLDVLRGLTIAFMIIVNDQSGPAPFFELSHAAWNGFTATDLVFPTFLLLIGVSTVLSTASRLARGANRRKLLLHTIRRTALLIFLGFVVNNFPFFHMATARYYGVLSRIGLCYFVVATLYLVSPGWKDKVVIAILCLVSYWALMRFVPVPGYGIPTQGVAINDRDGNLTAWLDRQIFTASHLYEHTRDPEGLLSTIPSIATCLYGLLAGIWLRYTASTARKAGMLAAAGAILLCLALIWNPFFPINKKLWTSTFSLFAGGWSLLLLAASIYVVDIRRLGRPVANRNSNPGRPEFSMHPVLYKPLLVLGTNAILAYLVSELGDSAMSHIHLPQGLSLKAALHNVIGLAITSPPWLSLVNSLAFLVLCWLVVLLPYRRRIFLRI